MSRFSRYVKWLSALMISILGCAVGAEPAEQASPLVGLPA